jgi:hypothetical protein
MECEKVRKILSKRYGKRLLCRIGNGKPVYNATDEPYDKADFAIYINSDNKNAAIWDLKRRRIKEQVVKTVSLSKDWNEIMPEYGEINALYKKMGTRSCGAYEKVLVMHIDVLIEIYEELEHYIMINPGDSGFLGDITDKDLEFYNSFESEERRKYSTKMWERNRKFREQVLNAYDYKCAICRCAEKQLLEAAHINAVAEGGTDNPENGICLCANHHIMFDRDLIKINFEEHTLSCDEKTLKDMPWYSEFNEKYEGKLAIPNFRTTSAEINAINKKII